MNSMRELFTVPMPDATIPEFNWEHGDDLCDCEFQRIGLWMNPYLGVTDKIRFCCLYKELEDSFPHLFQHIKGYWDDDENEWIMAQMEWNGEEDMPRALWNRQLSIREGLPIEVIRERTIFQSPPKGTPDRLGEKLQRLGNNTEAERIVSIATQQLVNNYAQAISQIEQMEAGMHKAIEDLKKLKSGEISMDSLVVTDNGYEIIPPITLPETTKNGTEKLDKVSSP